MDDFNWSSESERQWNERSAIWHSKSKDMWESGSRKDVVPFFQSIVPTGSSIWDFGCGDGYGTIKLAKAGYHVTGIDVSEEMISTAREMAKGINAHFLKGNIAKVDIDRSSIDAVIAINSLEWTENPLEVLMEMKRVIKPSGYACIGILGPTAMPRKHSFNRLYGEKVICNTMMPWELQQLAEENGWEKVADKGVYKRGINPAIIEIQSLELKQALSFMWIMIFKNVK
ncbi:MULTISPECIES: bifunctional 2-polyprenyl-6-hydroxyphenol methylase/3-demethylubiquinol 3-O-methyltransferase UbiG [unclassified Bacillus (in: firmicutes)]|uniref:class I SAM-dependent methyltransferase n=1 Tax=unclassified Bacillus (in: firmicutes) TaxID=185979 RepID=UPI0008EDCE59|nr:MULTISPECIES: class I SAM-dependent methyltransferase [unclassified Bacillus (in: firmicutes)]SFB25688.1 Methyltransferase domain-containing protein [Bacillus sp. UNCCL13]SFQ91802.1 Methyltransferase domain-containing protein [Bacillus sp. cl95]